MKIGLLSLTCVLAVFTTAPVMSQQNVRLLRPGRFLIDPPRIEPTEQWFGLRRIGDGWALVRINPKVAAVGPSREICGDRATDISVDIDGIRQPIALDGTGDLLFLVSGIQNLSERPITTTVSGPRFLYPGQEVKVGVQESDLYTLEALGTATRENADFVFVNYVLWLREGRRAQELASFERNWMAHPRQIVWAGDLDGDRRPDLLFDFPLGDVGHNFVLYLSSAAAGNQLVSRVATFSTPGC
jgi:hypothetical protein